MSKLGDVFGESIEGMVQRRVQELEYAYAHTDDRDFVELALVNARITYKTLLGQLDVPLREDVPLAKRKPTHYRGVPCTSCGAGIGQVCTTKDAQKTPAHGYHPARIKAFQEGQR